jgi:hypothetical protein
VFRVTENNAGVIYYLFIVLGIITILMFTLKIMDMGEQVDDKCNLKSLVIPEAPNVTFHNIYSHNMHNAKNRDNISLILGS